MPRSRKRKTKAAARPPDHRVPDLPRLSEAVLSRRQVAEILGISLSTVRRLEGQELHPVVRDGVNYFVPSEVEAISRSLALGPRSDGRLAAQIFVLLEQGLDLREIVVRAQVSPVQVRELYEEWCLSLEDGRQLRWSQLHLAQAPPPPAPRVAVAVAAAPDEPAAVPAAVALVDETPATDTISDTNDPMEHLLAAAERLLGQQTES
jgi:hypothetical protein